MPVKAAWAAGQIECKRVVKSMQLRIQLLNRRSKAFVYKGKKRRIHGWSAHAGDAAKVNAHTAKF